MNEKKLRCRDSEATQCAVLNAAQSLFAEKGFAGTSMRDISSASGISQPLIHYHFGNKEGLYGAVRERLIKGGLDSVLLSSDGTLGTNTDPYILIQTGYDYVCGNRDLIRLIAWSHLEGESSEWPGEQEFTRLLAERIQQHFRNAGPAKKFDPIVMAIMIEALILFWSQNGEYYAGLFEETQEQVTDRFLDHIVSLFFIDPDTKEKQ